MKKLLLVLAGFSIISCSYQDSSTVFGTVLPMGTKIDAKFDSGVSLFKNITPSEPTTISINVIDNKLTDCKAITSAYPDFASNRIMMRVNKINCGGRNIALQAYVIGNDGRAGVPNMGTTKGQIDITHGTTVKIITMNTINIESH